MLSEKVFGTFKLTNPADDASNFGCIASAHGLDLIEECVADAQKQNGIITIGGFKNSDQHGMGRFYEPTVIANVNEGMRCMMEQLSGPVVGV